MTTPSEKDTQSLDKVTARFQLNQGTLMHKALERPLRAPRPPPPPDVLCLPAGSVFTRGDSCCDNSSS